MTWSAIAICKCHWVARWISFSHTIASHTEELAGSMDNLRLPIVGVWRKATIVDEGGCAGLLPCLVSYLRYLGSVKDRYFKEGERRLYGRAGQVMMGYFLPNTSQCHSLGPATKTEIWPLFFFTNLLLHEPILISWKENEKQQYQSEAGYSEYTE